MLQNRLHEQEYHACELLYYMYFIDSLYYFISNIFTANITNTPNLSKQLLRKDVKQLTKIKTLIHVFYNDYIAIILMIKFVTEMLTQLLTTYA